MAGQVTLLILSLTAELYSGGVICQDPGGLLAKIFKDRAAPEEPGFDLWRNTFDSKQLLPIS
jgi:hypothetical protein